NDELRLLESQIKLKEIGIRQAEAEAIAKRCEIRQAVAEAKAKEADSENLRLCMKLGGAGCVRYLIGRPNLLHILVVTVESQVIRQVCWTRLQLNTGKPAMIVTEETNTSPVGVMADLSKADSMPIGLIFTKGEVRESAVSVLASRDFDPSQENFAKNPDVVSKLSSKSVVAARKTDKYVVLGSLWGQGVAPLVLVRVKSSCFSGIANIACVHELPVAGGDLILGNDLAGGQMGNVTPPPVLREKPESTAELQQLEDDMPGVSPLCDHNVTSVVDDSLSSKGLFANPIASQDISSAVIAVTGRVALIAAEEQDDSLRLLFHSANDSGYTTRYF
ncbi:hypothetical protein Hamer_G010010, partial [Homarus americanus]